MSSQKRQESKPWDAEGISRATWYRRHREVEMSKSRKPDWDTGLTRAEAVRQRKIQIEHVRTWRQRAVYRHVKALRALLRECEVTLSAHAAAGSDQ